MLKQNNNILVLVLSFAIFSILNTEIGIVGVLPIISNTFNITIDKAGILVSAFALTIAISGIIMPLLFSGINKKNINVNSYCCVYNKQYSISIYK